MTYLDLTMSLIDAGTVEVTKSETEVFAVPPTQTTIEGNYWKKYYTVTSTDHSGPLEFKIKAGEHDYINPSGHYLYTSNRILDTNGEPLTEKDDADQIRKDSIVFPINYFHATRFKNVETIWGGKSVTSNDNLYPYRALFETELNYSRDVKQEQMMLSLYSKDEGDMDECNVDLTERPPDSVTNYGAYERFHRTKYSKSFECVGRIHGELFSQPKLLLNGTTLTVKFHRHDQSFCLMAMDKDKRYVVSIDTAILFVNHTKISSHVREAHEIALLKTNAKYPIRQVKMRYFTKSAGRSDLSELNLINGVLPRKIVFGLVSSAAFTGHKHLNPFDFHHFNMQNVVLRVNEKSVPYENIEMNFRERCAAQGYVTLLQGTNRLYQNHGMDLSYDDFLAGHTLLAFDLTPDLSNSHCNLVQEGTVSLEIKLSEPTRVSVTMIVYAEYDNVITIDKDRNAQLE